MEKQKIIFVGKKNSRLAKSLLQVFDEEHIKFIDSRKRMQNVLEEVSRNDVFGKTVDIYFQVGDDGYGYRLPVSRCPMHEKLVSIFPKNLKYNGVKR